MRRDNLVFVLTVTLILTLFAIPAFSQESQTPVGEEPTQPEELSVYGEVQSINQTSNSITIQYYDYDSDEEKPMEIILNKDTKIENAAALNDIKQNDWVDITYSVSDAKFIAKSIKVEKEEEFPLEIAPEEAPLEVSGEE